LQYNAWHEHIDLTTDYGKRWFYATIRDFYSAIPPKHWAMLDGKPIVLLYASAFAKKHDQAFVDFAKAEFKKEFAGRDLYVAPQDSWQVKGDNTCAWGGAFGLKNPGIAELGPGYNDSAVYGRTPLIAKREGGKLYEQNWLTFLRRPSNFVMIETWSEFHEGTEICESKEHGRQYIELTRKYSDLYKHGWTPPWPKGPFSQVAKVTAAPGNGSAGLRMVAVEDSRPTTQTDGNRGSWVVKPASGQSAYLYFQVDDSFKWSRLMNTRVQVEYLDGAPGLLGVEFDGSDTNAPLHGAYTRSAKIRLQGDRRWKTNQFNLERGCFLNSQNGAADFRLVAEAPELVVGQVTLQRR
jgi:hypothetical protein